MPEPVLSVSDLVEYELEYPLTILQATEIYERVICAASKFWHKYYFKAENEEEGVQVLCTSRSPPYLISLISAHDEKILGSRDVLAQYGEYDTENVNRVERWEREYALKKIKDRYREFPLDLLLTYRKARLRHVGSDLQLRIERRGRQHHVQLWASRKLRRDAAASLTEILAHSNL